MSASGNVHLNPLVVVYKSQFYRFCSVNLTAKDFKTDITQLINTLHSQGYYLKMKFIQFVNITGLNLIKFD